MMKLPSMHGWETDQFRVYLAHELGHLLGLGHTTEEDFTTQDQLFDTPACTLAQASQRDDAGVPLVVADDCAGHGLENVMFWVALQTVPF